MVLLTGVTRYRAMRWLLNNDVGCLWAETDAKQHKHHQNNTNGCSLIKHTLRAPCNDVMRGTEPACTALHYATYVRVPHDIL